MMDRKPLVLNTKTGTFVEVNIAKGPQRELSGIEQDRIERITQLLHTTSESLIAAGVHADFRAGVVQSYEKVLDAVMYGYPAAILDGWHTKDTRED